MSHLKGSDPAEVFSAASVDALDPTEIYEARERRIDDYLSTALTIEDALRSNLAAINADLMRQALYVEHALRDVQGESLTSIEAAQAQESALNDLLRIAKQIDRYAQLEIKLRAEKPGSGSG